MAHERIITYQDPETGLYCARIGRAGRVFRARTEEAARRYASEYGAKKP